MLQLEIAGAGDFGDQLARIIGMIVIHYGQFDILHFIIRRQWQYDQLNGRHDKYDAENGRIPEDLPELFLQQEF